MTLENHKELDRLLMDELNVKSISRPLGVTETGKLFLEFDGTDYRFMSEGKDVTTSGLLEILPRLLSNV
jgi:hypothetical protein